jgi:hypothetical protein
MEGLGLLSTGVLLLRRSDYCSLTAAATSALVLVDAWFDMTTAASGAAQVIAIAMAAGIEIPVSGLCGWVAVRAFPRRPQENPTLLRAGLSGRARPRRSARSRTGTALTPPAPPASFCLHMLEGNQWIHQA